MDTFDIVAVTGAEGDTRGVDASSPPELRTFGAAGAVTIHLLSSSPAQLVRAKALKAGNRDPNVSVAVIDTAGVLPVRYLAHDIKLLRRGLDKGTVWVNGDAGPEVDRVDLIQLATAYELPVRHVDGTRVIQAPRHQMPPSRLVRALHFSVSKVPSEDNEVLLREMGFAGLVGIRSEKEYAATPALLDLFADQRFVGVKDTESACADLLDRLGDHRRARKLRGLIQRWIRNRLWSVNQVPEMVAHNEDHAVAVDRNISFLCESITRPFQPGKEAGEIPSPRLLKEIILSRNDHRATLSTRDLYLLAVAAWLHDWGHASLVLGASGFVTDPVVVRNYHGYMSAELISSHKRAAAHGLKPSADKPDERYEEALDQAEIRILCAHHQGSSSCGPLASASEGKGLHKSTALKAHLSLEDRVHGELERVDADSPKLIRDSLPRIRLLVAILRVADAADVGGHRTPDFEHQTGAREAVTEALFQLRAPMRVDAELELSWVKEMAEIQKAITALRGKILPEHTAEEVKSIIAQVSDEPEWRFYPEDGDDKDPTILAMWSYALHVISQSGFYQLHHTVRCAVPFISDERHLRLAVVPDKNEDPGGAWKSVETDILREFGKVRGGDGGPLMTEEKPPGWKGPIREAFSFWLGVTPTVDAVALPPESWSEVPLARAALAVKTAPVGIETSGVLLSAAGDLAARKVGDLVTFTFGGAEETRRFKGSVSGDLLAVGWVDGAHKAVVLAYPRGLGLVGEGGISRILDTEPGARAAALTPDAVLWADGAGRWRAHCFQGSALEEPPTWLVPGEILHLDAASTGKGTALAVLQSTDGKVLVRTGLVTEEGAWLRGPWIEAGGARRVEWLREPGRTCLTLSSPDLRESHEVQWADG